MDEYMHLIGADDVRSAGHTMSSAARDMHGAASEWDAALHRHRVFLDDWLMRFEAVIETLKERVSING